MTSNVLDILKCKDLVIPGILIKYKDKLNIDEKELLFLAYLISFNSEILLDINKISNELNITSQNIMVIFSSLCEKNLINMVVNKDNGKIKEYINIDNLYNKILTFCQDINKEEQDVSKIYEIIEKEFGRTLSPIEYEIIKQWLDSNISEELILSALKEAVLNGVSNLKYIDRILFEWTKKGYTRTSDIKKKITKEEKVDDFEYDWLDENE